MNIGFVFTTLSEGGIGRVSSIIMNMLSKVPDYHIYGFLYAPSDKPEVYHIDDKIETEYLLDRHVSMHAALLKKGLVRKLRKELKRKDIDILIACGDLHFLAAVLAKQTTKTKVICWDHTGPNINTDIRMQRASKWLATRLSDYNLVLTKNALKTYNKKISRKKNFQIYNPIDPLLEAGSYVFNEKSRKIISVGRLCYQKNYARLLDIAQKILPNYPDWTWDIFGDGPEKDELLRKCSRLGLEKQICFKGIVHNIYDLYEKYAFIVMTSRYEGFPMTLLEASSKGLPMVAFDVETGPDEIIIDGENGFLCNHDDDLMMVHAIERLMNDPILRKSEAQNSYNSSMKFRNTKILGEWINMFNTIVKG